MRALALLLGLLCCGYGTSASAHAIVGERVFPATLAIDDPGVSDELTLPQISRFRTNDTWNTGISAEFAKRLTENLGVSAGASWLDAGGTTGMDNVELGAKYVFFKNAPHEAMISAGLNWEIGGSGAKRIASPLDTYTPALFFGKGMGDLPDSAEWLKPVAITGTLGLALPNERSSTGDTGDRTFNPNVLQWGFTLQYSLPYLQQHVRDIGLGKPLSLAVPIVEFSFAKPTGGGDRATTGTVNPGVVFMGQDVQLGLEATIPANRASGDRVGYVAQLHFYLDDLFPSGFGRPLW